MLELPRALSLWIVIPIAATLIAAALEVGYRLGRRQRLRTVHESERAVTDLATPAVGLLGLMLAFTFAWTATRFDARRAWRFEEARDIASVFRYADFLSPNDRDRVRELLREYVDVSLTAKGIEGFERAFAAREAMHQELWRITAVAGRGAANSEIVALLVSSTNEMLNDHLERTVAALSSRIPHGIVLGLLAILVATMGILGYQMGLTSPTRSPAVLPLLISITLVVYLILDLDRSLEGALRVRDAGLIEVRRQLQSWR